MSTTQGVVSTLNDYGFVSQYAIDPNVARDRIKFLYYDSGIKEFQFYDCMERYELPLPLSKSEWQDPLGRRIRRETIEAYLNEIARLGGRSWFYIPIYSVSPHFSVVKPSRQLFTRITKSPGEIGHLLDVDGIVRNGAVYFDRYCRERKVR